MQLLKYAKTPFYHLMALIIGSIIGYFVGRFFNWNLFIPFVWENAHLYILIALIYMVASTIFNYWFEGKFFDGFKS
ncbi:MAG: hypothetical protein NTX86_02705 [Candidatus Dependentiae bacterium]|nr:hypothetical protein [Candidatus Dependentiae bacterium]